ncbi:zinc transporter 2-like [Triticum urartu]|uniref:zinc transporter 2-like n=1 Tax=Triticum urartu TaxID=4572 RepID=UPI00204491D1|nr:zinc transporter 2-like [Triticum urartu]XP_048574980.1 zinc transporter 2-like [Triticum urartu]
MGMASATSSRHLLLLVLWLSASASTAWAHGGGGHGDGDADGGAKAKPDLRAPGLVAVKLWCLALVFAGTLAGGVSPYFMRWNEAFLALGTQFAGGVILGTAMMHFLSDADETFGDLAPHSDYPFASMLACAGYVLIMLVSSVVARGPGRTAPSAGALEEGKLSSTDDNSIEPQTSDAHGPSTASMLRNASTIGDGVLLIAALCFHSVFEGIAIGVAETEADAWKALWTISLHKILAAIAMGISLLRMLPDRPLLSCFGYAFAFAVSSPIGVAVSILVDATTEGRVADWIYAISMGLATGIFVYVSINHLLAKGYRPQRPVGRWLAVALGVGVIAVVMIWDA